MTKLLEMTNCLLSGSQIAKQFYVKVKMDGFKTDELLINAYENLPDKLIYFHNTYDQDLKHKHAPIEIVEYGYILKDTTMSNELNNLIRG